MPPLPPADACEEAILPEWNADGMWACLLSSDGTLPWTDTARWRRVTRRLSQLRVLTVRCLTDIGSPVKTSRNNPSPPDSSQGPTHRFIRNLTQDCPNLRRVYVQSLIRDDAFPRMYFIEDNQPPHRSYFPFPNQQSDLEYWYDPSPVMAFDNSPPSEMMPSMEQDIRDLDSENLFSAFLRSSPDACKVYSSGLRAYRLCDRCAQS